MFETPRHTVTSERKGGNWGISDIHGRDPATTLRFAQDDGVRKFTISK